MKRLVFLLICIIAVFPLSGCWSSKEPKEMAYVDSAMDDKNEDGTFTVIAEIMNPQGLQGAGMIGGGGGKQNPYITIAGTGTSIREAITDQSVSRERIDFGAHIKANLLTERFARDQENVISLLDLMARESLTDEKPQTLVVKGDHPEKIYDSMLGTSSMVGDYIDQLRNNQPKNMAKGVFVTVLEFIRDYYTEGKEPVTGLITLVESTDKSSGNTKIGSSGGNAAGVKESVNYSISYEGLAAFRDAGLVGFMDGTEAQAYNFIENKIQAAYITVPVDDIDSAVLNISNSNTEIKANVINGKAEISINVKAIAAISEDGGRTDVMVAKGQKAIEGRLNSKLEQQILETINKAQTEFKSDIFGFGEFLHIQHPDIWKNVKSQWNDDYFANAVVSVTVISDVSFAGEIKKPIELLEGTQK